jgi:hypothetical protein
MISSCHTRGTRWRQCFLPANQLQDMETMTTKIMPSYLQFPRDLDNSRVIAFCRQGDYMNIHFSNVSLTCDSSEQTVYKLKDLPWNTRLPNFWVLIPILIVFITIHLLFFNWNLWRIFFSVSHNLPFADMKINFNHTLLEVFYKTPKGFLHNTFISNP